MKTAVGMVDQDKSSSLVCGGKKKEDL